MRKMNEKWITTWGNAISITERRPENYAKNLTLRYPITIMLDASAIRITLDNFCGNESVTITSAFLAKSDGANGIVPDTIVPLQFNRNASVTIPAGERIKSDAVSFPIKRGEKLAVSLYFADFTEMRSGVMNTGSMSQGYFAVGDQTQAEHLHPDTSKKTHTFYFLSDIEVLTNEKNRTVICFGDSITAQAWPDDLIQRVLKDGDGTTAIIRKAASGTRILRQYDNITYDSYGLKGATRFPREIEVSGADTVIIQHGINDIIHPVGTDVNPFRPWSDLPSAEDLIEGLRFYVKIAREKGLRVYIGTLLPIAGWRTYAEFRETLRNEVNTWIRTTDEIDGCIDFDRALCDPQNPTAFADGFDSGDHLHPSAAAYEKMAETIPSEILHRKEENRC